MAEHAGAGRRQHESLNSGGRIQHQQDETAMHRYIAVSCSKPQVSYQDLEQPHGCTQTLTCYFSPSSELAAGHFSKC